MSAATVELTGGPEVAGRLSRVMGEFLEMPGLRLTVPQAQRLFGLDRESSRILLDMLVDVGFLQRQVEMYSRPLDDR
jgi:hypothetical protein